MEKAIGRILKGKDVKLEGRFHLDLTQAGLGPLKEKGAASGMPQARIVENRPQFAVIQITCSCGTKMYLRCEYAGAQAPADGSQVQENAPAVPDQVSNQTK